MAANDSVVVPGVDWVFTPTNRAGRGSVDTAPPALDDWIGVAVMLDPTIPDPRCAHPEPPEHIFPATMSREEYDEDITLRVAAIRRLIDSVRVHPDVLTVDQTLQGIDGLCHSIERTVRRYGSAA